MQYSFFQSKFYLLAKYDRITQGGGETGRFECEVLPGYFSVYRILQTFCWPNSCKWPEYSYRYMNSSYLISLFFFIYFYLTICEQIFYIKCLWIRDCIREKMMKSPTLRNATEVQPLKGRKCIQHEHFFCRSTHSLCFCWRLVVQSSALKHVVCGSQNSEEVR